MKESERLVRAVCAERARYEPLTRACEYGPAHWSDGEWTGEVGYYWFLAGLVDQVDAKRVFEAGTHFGGSARAFAAAGAEVFTCDVTPDGASTLAGVDRITAVTQPAAAAVEQCREMWGTVDLVFIDVDHHFTTTVEAIVAVLALEPRWIVLDDIRLDVAMDDVWRWVNARFADTFDVDDHDPTVRDGVGLGVVALHQKTTQNAPSSRAR